jgi:hypothetical protein
MAAESDVMPASQLARWAAIAVLIIAAVVLYFREGRGIPPLGPAPVAVPDSLLRPVPEPADSFPSPTPSSER